MRKLLILIALGCMTAMAETVPFGAGQLTVTTVAQKAVRIQYSEGRPTDTDIPDWLYVVHYTVDSHDIAVQIDSQHQRVTVKDALGRAVFVATGHQLMGGGARLTMESPADECIYGLGQFQDGFCNIRGLSRRLTQVNTQISIPMMLSSKGYGVLWNNYGMTEFNPCDHSVRLQPAADHLSAAEVVNVTSTEGGRQEVRRRNLFEATVDVAESGNYALLLDVGARMARRHNLTIDGKPVIEMQNLWLPPTASTIVSLSAGRHHVAAELAQGDQPVLYYREVDNRTVLSSPVATQVDYTVFVGSPDEIIATYRHLTGEAPLMPRWALGYIHCRERFHSSQEILQTARRFRHEQLPVDVLVQDWQYWGKHGWNSMRFDEEHYPDPKALTDSLHNMGIRLMLSVWSKIDKRSDVGREMMQHGYYIPGTDWIDFFNPDAASAYWQNFSRRLVPLGIDAWWQDATEPENDDLAGRRVNNGRWSGEQVRNVYPLLVNKTVYEGLTGSDSHGNRPMILTRSGFAGIQRYGSALWSGDVGNDWQTLRYQLTAGLGMQAAGIPWWTYDAGGFFRPQNQYTDAGYIERMLRWIEACVYLPLMRVHGYMSNTEPWNYGSEAQRVIARCLQERYRLLPYIYSNAAAVAFEGSTLMRPLVFDFADDAKALRQDCEYMFGKSLLISPVTEPGVTQWQTYLPQSKGGWYDRFTNRHYDGGQTVTTAVDNSRIPVFVRAGSIIPLSGDTLCVYPGADGEFTLYEDDGTTMDYKQGRCTRTVLKWDDRRRHLTIGKPQGRFDAMPKHRKFTTIIITPVATTLHAAGDIGKQRIVEDGGTGPYKALMYDVPTLPEHTIFAPQDLSAFGKHHKLPVLVWGNGACSNSPWEHYKFLNEIASHGFLVIATGYFPENDDPYRGPMSRTEQQIESIDWVMAQNADPQSPYYNKIDVKHICLSGMSCGGLQSLFNCADKRITSLMICNSGLFKQSNRAQAMGGMPMPDKEKLNEIHTPVMYILGGETDIAYENGMDDFHRINHVPALVCNYPVGHGGTYRQPHGGEFTVAALAWLQWQLKGDREAARMLSGDSPLLLQRDGWTIEKNAMFNQLK